jgi:hypothetical protein
MPCGTSLRGRLDPPCLDLDPVPVALINDLLVQIEQGFNTGVASHTPVYQLLIKISSSTIIPFGWSTTFLRRGYFLWVSVYQRYKSLTLLYNPVKHGHVTAVAQWPYSTFHRWVKAGVYPVGWGGDGVTDVPAGERT